MYRRIVSLILVLVIATATTKDSRAQFGFGGDDDSTSGERTSTFFDGGKKEPFFKLPKLSSLNPFKGDDSAGANTPVVTASATEPAPATTAKSSGSWFSPMKPLGYIKKPFVYTATKSKQALVKTVDFLNPFDGSSKAEPPPGFLPATQGYRPQDMNRPVKKPLWHYLLPYDPEPPKQEFNDVNGFLRQGMPSFK